jgi:hypothetical protein
VTQVGRVFQHDHRDVPVLLDKGRYLVVAMDPERAQRVQPRQEVCYGVRPLQTGTVVFRTVTPAQDTEAHVQNLVDMVSKNRYERSLTRLAAFPTRRSLRPGFLEADGWPAASSISSARRGACRHHGGIGFGTQPQRRRRPRGGRPQPARPGPSRRAPGIDQPCLWPLGVGARR